MNSWIVRYQPNPQACLRLFCYPYAGAGASIFQSWSSQLPAAIEVCSVQLPGRERRFREPLFTDLPSLIEALTPALLPHLDLPFAFFGHSVGALISFETARQLRRSHYPSPLHLFVSGRSAPQISALKPPIHHLPDAQLVEKLREYNGTPTAVLENAELMSLFLPILRADLAINETYVYDRDLPLACPISAFGGLNDEIASPDAIAAWREQTCDRFAFQMFPGDHFFLKSQQAELLQAIALELLQIVRKI
ncbi:thioesterase [Microcoleus sp. FACHB-1515]|uniref:thioesterase II family protein n=1 Tax=Cyanophyceae TaxID=3028117 RepID=UPI001688CD10|nr:thioesterase II family protein [Microcoleus sp. FACHB-1515]MBD2091222.1 thioesterase [Microcoleus sp. FACHB-1515]